MELMYRMKTRSGVTLYLPRYSMEQGSTAVCPATTVTFTIGTSKAGSKPTTNNTRARHVIICQLNIDNIRMGFSNDPHHWYTAIDYKHYSMIKCKKLISLQHRVRAMKSHIQNSTNHFFWDNVIARYHIALTIHLT